MDKETLAYEMRSIIKIYEDDPEVMHSKLDKLMLKFINDKEVTKLFNSVEKWYA